MELPKISIVVPLYNEAKVYPFLVERLNTVMEATPYSVEVVLVDDGSSDETPLLMAKLSNEDHRYHSVFLSKNFGHQLALTAGLSVARGTEAIMIIDGDLQDPPELIEKFYNCFKEGYDVVYAVRKKRKESALKKSAYFFFYRILNTISYIDIPLDSGDFSLVSRKVVDLLNSMPEESRYIRGMRTWVGFKQIGIEYERDKRSVGESKYSFKMLFKLAYNGIFNFSEFPIKFITRLGVISISISLIYLVYNIYKRFVLNEVPEGFTALLFTLVLFSGVQLISLGVIGEYVLRIFFQSKKRPLFIISKQIVNQAEIS